MMSQPKNDGGENPGGLIRLGLSLADCCERWFPDAFVFALLGVVITFIMDSSWERILRNWPLREVKDSGCSFPSRCR